MHGIRREDFYKTAEEAEAFKRKLEKGYKLLDSFVNNVRESECTVESCDGILGDPAEADRMFELSTAIIDFMPEYNPSWHYRKNYFLQPRLDRERLVSLLLDELVFTESVLKKTPKCFSLWQHRLWVLTLLFNMRYSGVSDILTKELSLCMTLFKVDGRNFHCWGHVNYVRHYLKVLESEGLSGGSVDDLCYSEFSKLIAKNFSNFSAWCHRGQLSETHGSLADELDTLTPAIYTDPNDQCLWEHFDWLLYRRNALGYYLVRSFYCSKSHSFVFYFNDCVKLWPSDSFIIAGVSEENCGKLDGTWSAISCVSHNRRLQDVDVPEYAWRYTLYEPCAVESIAYVSLSLTIETDEGVIDSFYSRLRHMSKCNLSSELNSNGDLVPCLLALRYKLEVLANGDMPLPLAKLEFSRSRMDSASGWEDLSSVLRGPAIMPYSLRIVSLGKDVTDIILEQQLDMIKSLLSMDTDSKYLYLAMHKIRQQLGQPSDSEDCYANVARIDPLRGTLYGDLEMFCKVKRILDATAATGSACANLADMNLRHLSYRILQPHVLLEELDLSDNLLSDSSLLDFGLYVMFKLRHVILSGNKFTSLSRILDSFRSVVPLERLNLSGNPLAVETDWAAISLSPFLREIDVSDTPLSRFILEECGLSGCTDYASVPFPHLPDFCVTIYGPKPTFDEETVPSIYHEGISRVLLCRSCKKE
ncbi:Geranylgeranyl transferase type-2 subunit alpha [Babesia sp. Xinjiang]|uniref:Geranylgeranyl transferase type-2 subunit alpha n=1 Tax=Babesia sp. Xinjiang TaxID=462227 RepID=UPI000A244783|nr:Geranylgeranyl transferase type-2 subunit alpha [Babesia sp. Xinjiang]ORM40074.1 Geranylgeranyl transferase type-2 subunit alpha [Babesia sp. Xinjiang]